MIAANRRFAAIAFDSIMTYGQPSPIEEYAGSNDVKAPVLTGC